MDPTLRREIETLPSAAANLCPAPDGWRRREQPDGVLFFHRGTGLNVLVEQRGRGAPRAPRLVQLALLDACNIACSFCYASKAGHRWPRERLLDLCAGLDAWGVLEVALGGGEPFAYPDLAGLLVDIWDRTGLAVHVTTNGLLVPDGFAERVAGRVGEIRVSVDGVGATYERLRGTPFGAVEEGLRRLEGLRVGLNCLATRETLEAFGRYCQLAVRHGIRDVLLLRPMGPGSHLRVAEQGRAVRDAVLRAAAVGVQVRTSCNLGSIGLPTSAPVLPCAAGRDFVYITSDGAAKAASTAPAAYAFAGVADLRRIWATELATPDGSPCRAGCFSEAA